MWGFRNGSHSQNLAELHFNSTLSVIASFGLRDLAAISEKLSFPESWAEVHPVKLDRVWDPLPV